MSKLLGTENTAVANLVRHPFVNSELDINKSRATGRFGRLEPLEVAFVQGPHTSAKLVGQRLFGYDNVLGIITVDGVDGFREARQKILDNPILRTAVGSAQISLMYPGDPQKWADFYTQVLDEDWIARTSGRVRKYSGLRRIGTAEVASVESALEKVVLNPRTASVLESRYGVKPVRDGDNYGLDVALLDENGRLVSAPLNHVRRLEMRGEIIEASVESEAMVPGFVLPRFGENERETYSRARLAARKIERDGLPVDNVPIFDLRQARLSQKLSLVDQLHPQLEGANVDLERLFYFLFLGDSYLQSGALSGYSLPGNASEMLGLTSDAAKSVYGLDVVIMKKDLMGRHRLAPLGDPIWGLSLRKDGPLFKPVSNVGAMVAIPDNWEVDQVREHVDRMKTVLKRHVVSPDGELEVVPVNQELTQQWYERGIFVPKGPQEIEVSTARPSSDLDRGESQKNSRNQSQEDGHSTPYYSLPLRRGRDAGMYYVRWVPKGQEQAVGGGKTAVVFVEPDGTHKLVMTNMGHDYNVGTPAESGIGGKPPTHSGIWNELGNGQLPIIPGAYALTELYRTAAYAAWHRNSGDIRGAFLRAELARRGNPSLFEEIIVAGDDALTEKQVEARLAAAKYIFRQGSEDALRMYDGIEMRLLAAVIPHGHFDHFPWFRVLGNGKFVNGEEEFPGDFRVGDETYYMGPLTHAFLAQKRAKSPWSGNLLEYVHMEVPREGNNPYPKDPRRIAYFDRDGEVVQLANGATIEGRRTNHSMPHTVATLFTDVSGGANLLSVGDFKPGPLTEKMIAGFAGRPNVIEIETTNGPDSRKPRKTEDDLRSTFERVCRVHQGLVIAAAPDNNPDRLALLVQTAKDAGREGVVVDAKIAAGLEFLRFEIGQAAIGGNMFEGLGPYPIFGDDVYYWDKPGDRPQKYVRALRNLARAAGIAVDSHSLGELGSKSVLIVSPYDNLSAALTGVDVPPDSAYFHSTFRPYSVVEAANIAGRFNTLQKMGFSIYSQFGVKGSGRSAYIEEGSPTVYNYERLGLSPERFATHISGHGFYEDVKDTVLALLDGKYKGKTVLLTHGQRPGVYKESFRRDALAKQQAAMQRELDSAASDIHRVLGLSNPGDLRIVSQMRHYDPGNPLHEPFSRPVIYNTFTYKIG